MEKDQQQRRFMQPLVRENCTSKEPPSYTAVITVLLLYIIVFNATLVTIHNTDLYTSDIAQKTNYVQQTLQYLHAGGELTFLQTREEIIHMQDVHQLFGMAKVLYVLSILLLATLLVQKPQRIVSAAKYASYTLVAITVVVSVNFIQAFMIFHQLLFTNDYWLLPAQSILIQLYPTHTFVTLATVIFITSLITLLVLWISTSQSLKNTKPLNSTAQ